MLNSSIFLKCFFIIFFSLIYTSCSYENELIESKFSNQIANNLLKRNLKKKDFKFKSFYQILNSFIEINLSRRKFLNKNYTNNFKENFDINQRKFNFCPCPPLINNTFHNLQEFHDQKNQDCIYLPSTVVKYKCDKYSKLKKIKKDLTIIDQLICSLDENLNFNWIFDFTNLIKNHSSIKDKIKKKNRFNELIDFNLQFIQCEYDENKKFEQINYIEDELKIKKFLYNTTFHKPRFKRSISLERHVEVLIVVDYKMNEYHESNLKNYIYTLMSAVASIYKDSSIENNINIAIVQIIILNKKETNNIVSNLASNTLERFCEWQSNLNLNRTDNHPLYHDTAILLTRTDLCRSNENCHTLGLAHSSKICNGKLSCAIVEDNGLSTAFTIAHELGHILGIPHDQDEKCQRFNFMKQENNKSSLNQFSIMGKMLDYDSYPWKWSSCSAYYITEIFDSSEGDCLLDKPLKNFLDVVNLKSISEEEISINYEKLMKRKISSDNNLLNLIEKESKKKNNQKINLFKIRNGRNLDNIDRQFFLKNQTTLLPGQYFNINLQCQLIFGFNSKICPYMPECKSLWCTSSFYEDLNSELKQNLSTSHEYSFYKKNQEISTITDTTYTGCKTQYIPWADGTPCNTNNENFKNYFDSWCIKGECVSKKFYLSNNKKVNGNWGNWSEYTNCTRQCGGGIQNSFRECNNPKPKNGGDYCLGQRIRYKSCNKQKCAKDVLDFREEQCAFFNGKKIKNLPANVSWIPFYTGISREDSCKLYCRVESSDSYFVLKDKVIDGTDCWGNNKCINGKCVNSGCDNDINSTKVLDFCGVCAGKNSSCTIVSGVSKLKKVKYGYNSVVTIPARASNIIIKQINSTIDDDNSLALRTSNGTYLINGDATISTYERIVYYEGVRIDYSGTGIILKNNFENEITQEFEKMNNIFHEKILRLADSEKKLIREYSFYSNLDKNKKNVFKNYVQYLNQQHLKVKKEQNQLKLLMKNKTNEFNNIKQSNFFKKNTSFVEMIVIKKPIKKPLYVEVLSVGELLNPKIVYQFSISKKNFQKQIKNYEKYKYSFHDIVTKYDKNYLNKTYVNFNKNHSNSYKDIKIMNKIVENGFSKKKFHLFEDDLLKSTKNIEFNKQNKIKSKQIRRDLDKQKNIFRVGQTIELKKGMSVKIRCPPKKSLNTKINKIWFKNQKMINFKQKMYKKSLHYKQIYEKFSKDLNFKLNNTLNQIDQLKINQNYNRFFLTKRGALKIINLQPYDSGIFSCPYWNDYTHLNVS